MIMTATGSMWNPAHDVYLWPTCPLEPTSCISVLPTATVRPSNFHMPSPYAYFLRGIAHGGHTLFIYVYSRASHGSYGDICKCNTK